MQVAKRLIPFYAGDHDEEDCRYRLQSLAEFVPNHMPFCCTGISESHLSLKAKLVAKCLMQRRSEGVGCPEAKFNDGTSLPHPPPPLALGQIRIRRGGSLMCLTTSECKIQIHGYEGVTPCVWPNPRIRCGGRGISARAWRDTHTPCKGVSLRSQSGSGTQPQPLCTFKSHKTGIA